MDLEAADPFVVAGTRLSSRLLVGTGKFAAHPVMRDAVLASGTSLVTVALRRVDLDRLGDGDILDFIPAGGAAAAEHLRRGRRGRGRPAGPARPGRDRDRLGQARGDPGPADAGPGPDRDAAGGRAAGGRRVHRAAVLLGRPGAVPAAGGGRLRDGDAAGSVDRLQPRAADPGRDRGDRRPGRRAGGGGRRARGAQRRRRGDGGRRGRGAGEHRDRGGPGPGRDGPGVRAGDRGRPAGLAGPAAARSGPRPRPSASSPADRLPRRPVRAGRDARAAAGRRPGGDWDGPPPAGGGADGRTEGPVRPAPRHARRRPACRPGRTPTRT